MPTRPHFRVSLLAAKERLVEGREKLRALHEKGASGVNVCARQTDLLDAIVVELFDAALADLNLEDLRQHMALVPLAGYGRRDLAPYSDLDLMILYQGIGKNQVARLVTRFMQDLFDAGLAPGHSFRTPSEAVQLARGDAATCTSLIESRFLAGNQEIYSGFRQRFEKMTQRRRRGLHEAIVAARGEEDAQYGETVYLLEPNIKRSRGGLRDIQLLRWIGFTRFGTSDPDAMARQSILSKHDHRRLQQATEFLLRLRNEMHFHAGKTHDVLERHEQIRLAEKLGCRGTQGLLPVEQFMQEYFRHTSQVGALVSRFVGSARPEPTMARALGPMFSHQVEGDYRVGRGQITATPQGQEKLKSDLDEVLRLAELASLYNKRIAPSTWNAVCRAAPNYPDEISEDVAARFLSLLAQPERLGELLRRLHELYVLERIIPAFRHARGLLQFNEYHKYTVDEHSFRAVEQAAAFAEDHGPVGEAYRQTKQKRVLHLALLLHDLGKGFAEDHSQVGLQIAEETTERLHLPPHEAEIVQFLVHKHLMMSHLAFRRDTSDPQLVVRFAVEVGSPEVLRMLYVLTCADLAAVGPGVLNSWKVEVLTELYQRTMEHLGGNAALNHRAAVEAQRDQVRKCLGDDRDDSWLKDQIDALPSSLLRNSEPKQVAEMLGRLRGLSEERAVALGEYLPDSQTVAYTIMADRRDDLGVFSKLTGALTSRGLGILSAEINSLAHQTIVDRFVVEDPDFVGAPPAERLESVSQALVASLDTTEPPSFRRLWGSDRNHSLQEHSSLPTTIRVDNSTSEQQTIFEVFTFDRPGLLYAIAHSLFEMHLLIGAARISTHLDQVVDVFYVTDPQHGKIEDDRRLEEIRARLLAAVEQDPEEAAKDQ